MDFREVPTLSNSLLLKRCLPPLLSFLLNCYSSHPPSNRFCYPHMPPACSTHNYPLPTFVASSLTHITILSLLIPSLVTELYGSSIIFPFCKSHGKKVQTLKKEFEFYSTHFLAHLMRDALIEHAIVDKRSDFELH